MLYVLERFLFRLARSAHRSNLILKGGMLLAALEERRPTRDVDLLAQAVDNDIEAVGELVRDVLAVPVDDGVEYDTDGMRAETTRDLDPYPGMRIVVPASVQRARQPLRIDVNIGDPVTPRRSRSRTRPCSASRSCSWAIRSRPCSPRRSWP